MAKNMAKKLQIRTAENNEGFLLDEISPGFDGTIVAMVSRKWDVYKSNGSYLSTDFILSDEKSNLIHCFANHNKSYKFLAKLEEGMLFSFKGFKIHSNRDKFRIFLKGQYILEFDGDTKVAKVTGDVGRYFRYPFQIVEMEELTPTDQLYVVDLIGYVTHVGEILTKSTRLPDAVQTNVDEGNLDEVDATLVDDVFEEPNRSPRKSKKGRVIVESESDGDDDSEENLEVNDEQA